MPNPLMTRLAPFEQTQLLRFFDELTAEQQKRLTLQIESIDFEQLQKLVRGHDKSIDWAALSARAEPPIAVRLPGSVHPASMNSQLVPAQARELGEAALREGQVAMLLVAGGQGTRLGFDLPKGMFPIGPVSGRSLFQMLCDRLNAMGRRYGADVPLYIMTSPATDEETRRYFHQEFNCGLKPEQLKFFCQGQMPAVDAHTGHVLLSGRDEVALSPDGHGGIVSALEKSGCLNDASQKGVRVFYYAQIDNPLAEVCDPLLIGYHLMAQSELTTQVVMKRFAKEKVGNVVAIDGKVQIIEYSDLPDAVAEQTNADGSLKLWAGNIAIHVLNLEFLQRVTSLVGGLPFHRALKKVPFVDQAGKLVVPAAPNAIKFERFVFDLLPLAKNALVVEASASDVFAPVKNADGAAVDTPELAKAAIVRLHKQWLEQAGARLEEGVRVEIHPGWALDSVEAREKIPSNLHLKTDTYFL